MSVTAQQDRTESWPLPIQAEADATALSETTVPPITVNPERMGGTPVIGIERLPVEYLISYLTNGGTVDEFVDEFSADREGVLAALHRIREALAEGWLAEQVDY